MISIWNKPGLKFICMEALAAITAAMIALTGCGTTKEASYTTQAMEAIEAMDYEEALNLLDQAEESGERMQLIDRGRGIAYMGLTRYDEAVEALESSLARGNWNIGSLEADTNYYLAAAFAKTGDRDAAIDVCTAILNMWPREKKAHYMRGVMYLESGRFDDAREDMAAAINADTTDYDMLTDVYLAMDAAGYRQAGQDFLTLTMTNNGTTMPGFDKGRIYYYMGEYDQARNALEEARDTGPEAVLYLGLSYEALGDLNYATSVYQGYLSARSEDARILNRLGICRMQTGDYDAAMDAFSRGIDTGDPSCMRSLMLNQVSACEHKGEFARAAGLMREYLSRFPDDPDALRENEFLSTR